MPRSPTGTIPDPRHPVDRWQRDGLGLLPRTRTAVGRVWRERLNRLIGWILMTFGVVGRISSVYGSLQFQEVVFALGAFIAALISLRGLQRVTWQERRKTKRRKPEPDL